MRSALALDLIFSCVPFQHDGTSLLLCLHCFITGKTLVCVAGELFLFVFFSFFQQNIFAGETVQWCRVFFYDLCIRNVIDLTAKQNSSGIFKTCAVGLYPTLNFVSQI